MPSFSIEPYWQSPGRVVPSGTPPGFPSGRPHFPPPATAAFAALSSRGKAVVVDDRYDKQDQYNDNGSNDNSDNDFLDINVDHIHLLGRFCGQLGGGDHFSLRVIWNELIGGLIGTEVKSRHAGFVKYQIASADRDIGVCVVDGGDHVGVR